MMRTQRSILTSLALVACATGGALPSFTALQTNVVERHYDRFGRPVGVSLNGERRTEIAYDDAAGRRISKNDERYEYNARGELVLATNVSTGAEFAYCYDDIGNRQWSREFGTHCTYVANELNQYTNIVRGGVVGPSLFDLDGNQTNVVTATGEWAVEYNGENRPVLWRRKSDGATIRMAYDRMGRRVRKNDETFVYDGYLNISQTIWDPTEPVATRPLVWRGTGGNAFYFHDGNKNVVDFVLGFFASPIRHYDYAPFGGNIGDVGGDDLHWLFSSEFDDCDLGLAYYNYRHYSSAFGRWLRRDPLGVSNVPGETLFVRNDPIDKYDRVGLKMCRTNRPKRGYKPSVNGCGAEGGMNFPDSYFGLVNFTSCCNSHDVCYGSCGADKGRCDENLSECMARACDRYFFLPIAWHERRSCRAMARIYGFALKTWGTPAYESAQDESCEWEECCEKSIDKD